MAKSYVAPSCVKVQPNLLGNYTDFKKLFIEPIESGQYAESTASEIVKMKRACSVLRKLLRQCVQSVGYSQVEQKLPSKQDFVLKVINFAFMSTLEIM